MSPERGRFGDVGITNGDTGFLGYISVVSIKFIVYRLINNLIILFSCLTMGLSKKGECSCEQEDQNGPSFYRRQKRSN